MKKVLWLIQAALFYFGTLAFAIIPASYVGTVGRLVGKMGCILIRKRSRIAVDNIRLALPALMKAPDWPQPVLSPEELARMMFCHLGMSLVEVCRLYHGRGKDVLERVELRGREHLDAARARGKGVVVLTGHCGNWELAALAISWHLNSKMSVVAKRQNNPYLNSMIEKIRLRYDNLIIYKKNAFRNMLAVIRQNGTIGILVDQAAFPEDGELINFLGRTAWATKAPVVLARKTGTAIVPAFIHREGDRHVIDIYPEISFTGDTSEQAMTENVQKYSSIIANHIARHPVDWYWVHRRWKRAGEVVSA